jgi:hypothetical protein
MRHWRVADGIAEDIASANACMNTVGVFTGNGNGTFSTEQSYPTGEYPTGEYLTSIVLANVKDGAHT